MRRFVSAADRASDIVHYTAVDFDFVAVFLRILDIDAESLDTSIAAALDFRMDCCLLLLMLLLIQCNLQQLLVAAAECNRRNL